MLTVQNLPATSRWRRQPSHQFQLRHRPFQIQPFLLAPVLPGETIKSALIQARCISDPLVEQTQGWWLEHYLFYVKHRDMPNSALWQQMVLQPGSDVSSAFTPGALDKHFHAGGGIDWVAECLRPVVVHYFRDDGEPYDACMIGGLPGAKINLRNWSESAMTDAQMPDGTVPAAAANAGQIDLVLQQWQLLREMKLTTATYEEFLASYGVRAKLAEPDNKPELLRYSRDWTYPSNTVDAQSGSVRSVASWSITERADKDRYFSEPGFIFGVTVARPKVYLALQAGAAANMLSDAFAWLPAVLRDDPGTSLRRFEAGAGPLRHAASAYYVDARDLFMHGDAFISIGGFDPGAGLAPGAPLAAIANALPLPRVGSGEVNAKYASGADLDVFMADGPEGYIRQDGVVQLNILSSVKDHTGPSPVVAAKVGA